MDSVSFICVVKTLFSSESYTDAYQDTSSLPRRTHRVVGSCSGRNIRRTHRLVLGMLARCVSSSSRYRLLCAHQVARGSEAQHGTRARPLTQACMGRRTEARMVV